MLIVLAQSLDGHPRCSSHSDSIGGGVGQIDTSALDERPPIRDPDGYAAARCLVGDSRAGAEWLCAMRSGECVRIEAFSGSRALAVISIADAIL